MLELLVFDWKSEPLTEFYQKIQSENNRLVDAFDSLVAAKEREYKDSTGWAERFRKRQQKMVAEGNPLGSVLCDPYNVGMSRKEYDTFRAENPTICQDLELKCVIGIYVHEEYDGKKGYSFDLEMPNWGVYNSVCDDLLYSDIPELISKIKSATKNISADCFGVKVVPVFYTNYGYAELTKLTDEEAEGFKEELKLMLEEEGIEFEEHIKEEQDKIYAGKLRGLSKSEMEEFIRLYQ